MEVIVDRIEDDFLVVELPGGGTENIPISLFEDVKEGDIIEMIINRQSTEEHRQAIQNKLNGLDF